VVWSDTAEIIEKYLEKGKVMVNEGKRTSISFVDKDGTKKYITEIVCNELLMLGANREMLL
jgi:single-strand DNA-binding protein